MRLASYVGLGLALVGCGDPAQDGADTDVVVVVDVDSDVAVNTDVPVDSDTDAPVDSDTDAPVDSDTDAPVDSDTDAPVDSDTDAPVDTEPPADTLVVDTEPPVDIDTEVPDTDTDTGPTTGFADGPDVWRVPDLDLGGQGLTHITRATQSRGAWATVDLDGDGLPDLVHTSGEDLVVFGFGTDAHWDLYLNTGTSFELTPVAWDVPEYDGSGRGFDRPDLMLGPYGAWATIDLDGDGRPELVHTADGTMVVHGKGTDAHWLVHANDGSGFDPVGTAWDVPDLDANGQGISRVAYTNNPYGSWATFDVDGDGLPDLVLMAVGGIDVLGKGVDAYWSVYRNTGHGFASTAVRWDVPELFATRHGLATTSEEASVGTWATLDLEGDARPDLVVLTDAPAVFGFGIDPVWHVYRNTGSGFATTFATWRVPELDGNGSGVARLTMQSTGGSWTTVDLDGDARPDLVHTGTLAQVLGGRAAAEWALYRNTGTGFDRVPTRWDVPDLEAGGYGVCQVTHDASSRGSWTVLDLDADGHPDLVHLADADAVQLEVHGFGGGAPRWDVYRGPAQ